MRRMPIFAIALVAAALLAPIAAQAGPASSGDDDGLRVQVVVPVAFGPFPGCADGVSFDTITGKHRGTGTACLLTDPEFSFCVEENAFCRDLETHWVLNLNGGSIEGDVNQHEVVTFFNPDPFAFSVDITWSGTVTGGTGKYHKLVGAQVSGGGPTSFDANGTQTGDLVLVIGEAPD